ncbi:putative lectin family integral membrane protein [Aspergillus taichungensis]|uniref:Putative lectin family integral membrane protein n=1 Tax=Aspergillus taichungensis TaxID=482145 RepID=A0A2J5HV28_9EURO|nr:putative lectin family integral membrane protein [Aspergillus taichungensis]
MKIPALLFSAAVVTAQSVIESSSFGYGQTLSPDRNSIPGWQLGGEGHAPQILSDKFVLTPPYPGNTRGFAWAQTPITQPEWTAEFQFRASGQERGGGNLQLWYAKDGQQKIGSSSIYTVGPFDGFALVVDTHGGRGGSVRGFLNDGSTDYKSHRSVDSLAFGHCDYSYRNLGRPSVVRIKHTRSIFEVTVDDKLCFSTNKIILPFGNTFGITAATPENPDSFEVFKFVAQTAQVGTDGSASNQQQQQQQQQPPAAQAQGQGTAQQPRGDTSGSNVEQQFVDLGARLQLINHATNNVLRELNNQNSKNDQRQADLLQKVASKDQFAALDARVQRIEQLLQGVIRDLEGKNYHERFAQLQDTLRSSHLSLTENFKDTLMSVVTASAPRMGFFIFVIVGAQAVLAVSYIVYKRRRASMPKKFL